MPAKRSRPYREQARGMPADVIGAKNAFLDRQPTVEKRYRFLYVPWPNTQVRL